MRFVRQQASPEQQLVHQPAGSKHRQHARRAALAADARGRAARHAHQPACGRRRAEGGPQSPLWRTDPRQLMQNQNSCCHLPSIRGSYTAARRMAETARFQRLRRQGAAGGTSAEPRLAAGTSCTRRVAAPRHGCKRQHLQQLCKRWPGSPVPKVGNWGRAGAEGQRAAVSVHAPVLLACRNRPTSGSPLTRGAEIGAVEVGGHCQARGRPHHGRQQIHRQAEAQVLAEACRGTGAEQANPVRASHAIGPCSATAAGQAPTQETACPGPPALGGCAHPAPRCGRRGAGAGRARTAATPPRPPPLF